MHARCGVLWPAPWRLSRQQQRCTGEGIKSGMHARRRPSDRDEGDRLLQPKIWRKRRTHVWKRQFSYA